MTSIMRNRTAINSRSKGASAERELGKILAEATGATWERNLDQCRDGGPDLLCPDFPAVALEVKRREKLDLTRWLIQAACQAKAGQIPVLAFRQSRRPWQFIIPLATIDDGAPPAALCQLSLDGFVWWLNRRRKG